MSIYIPRKSLKLNNDQFIYKFKNHKLLINEII